MFGQRSKPTDQKQDTIFRPNLKQMLINSDNLADVQLKKKKEERLDSVSLAVPLVDLGEYFKPFYEEIGVQTYIN